MLTNGAPIRYQTIALGKVEGLAVHIDDTTICFFHDYDSGSMISGFLTLILASRGMATVDRVPQSAKN